MTQFHHLSAIQRLQRLCLGRFMKFAVVGSLGVALNTGLLFVLVGKAHMPPMAGAAVATELVIIANFLANDRWTFRSAARLLPLWRRLLHYNAVALGGLLIATLMVGGLTAFLKVHYLAANLVAIAASAIWNYTGNVRFTWGSAVSTQSAHREEVDTAFRDEDFVREEFSA